MMPDQRFTAKGYRSYSPVEDHIITELRKTTLSLSDIAKGLFGRTPKSVEHRVFVLRNNRRLS